MADELQGLLDRIQTEGFRKTEAEAQRILTEARAEAARITAAAQADAKARLEAAEREAETMTAKGREALKQAGRDILLSLRQQLQERLQGVVRAGIGQALTPEALTTVIQAAVQAYLAHGGRINRLDILVNPGTIAPLEAAMLSRLKDDLSLNPTLVPAPGVKAGFQLVFNGEDAVYDFSDQALAEALGTFLSPKLAELIKVS